MEVVLQSVASKHDDNSLHQLANDISKEFENKIRVSVGTAVYPHSEPQFQSAFDTKRNQWNSPKLLDWFYEKFKPNKHTKILVVADIDAYSDGLNFVFGEAFHKGGLGAIYLPRIKQEFYGLKPDNELFYERMVKESVHELGHIFGFLHCQNPRCVMYFSNTLSDTDNKERSFCQSCRTTNFRSFKKHEY